MRNWHKKLIQVPPSATGEGVVIGIVDVGLLEFVKKGTNNLPVLDPANYKPAHPSFENNENSLETRVFFRKNDEAQKLSTENIKINNVAELIRNHITGVSGIMVAKSKDNNEIEGVAPNATLINSADVIDTFILTQTNSFAKKNALSLYYSKKVRKELVVDKEVPAGMLTPDNLYSKKRASIINFSISWKLTGVGTSSAIGNPNKEECKFMLNELFAYGRDGRGALVVAAAGNGKNNGSNVMIGEEITDNDSLIRASDKTIMVAASTIDTAQFYINPAQYDNNFQNISEVSSEYSNYGEKIDICAPSTPKGVPDAGSLGIYTPCKMYCGELGFDDQYITVNVVQKMTMSKLKLANTFGILPGQPIEIGNKSSFCNEIRYIIDVDRVNNIITLEKDLFFTRNIVIPSIKVLLFKKKAKRNTNPTENNKLTILEDIFGISNNQQVFIYGTDITQGIFTNITNVNNLIIEVGTNLSVFPLNETLNVVPGQMRIQLVGNGGLNGTKYDIQGNNFQGFFTGQQIRVVENGFICDLSSIDKLDKKATIVLLQKGVGEVINIESLGYGHYKTKFGGTSAASPIISSVAALVLAANPLLSAAEVKHILKHTTTKIVGPYNAVTTVDDYNYGYTTNLRFGTGRVNAEAAIALATDWNKPATEKPKMLFWDTPNGSEANTLPDSPDIWIAPKNSADSLVPDSNNPYNTLITSKDQKIYVRVRNAGNRSSFKETDLRVLVAFTSETNPVFKFPDCWQEDTSSPTMKTILLDVREILPIAPNSSKVLTIEWKNLSDIWKEVNPTGNLSMYILAHIAPFDAAISEVDLDNIKKNKNLTCREIKYNLSSNNVKGANGKISIMNNDNKYDLMVENQTTNKKFSFENINIKSTLLDTMEFKFSLINKISGNIQQEITVKKINGNWTMDGVPSSNWLNATMNITDSTLYAGYKNAILDYEFNYDNNDKEITFNVINA